MGQSPKAVVCLLLLCVATAAGQKRSLQQANAPAVAPRAKIGTKTAPRQPTNFKLVRGAPVNTENGAFVGCFDVTKLVGIDWASQHKPAKITQCRKVRHATAAAKLPPGRRHNPHYPLPWVPTAVTQMQYC
jgi:hypothetical protein